MRSDARRRTMSGVHIEIMFAYFALQRWKANPSASKRQIGLRSSWKLDSVENYLPLSRIEVTRMKRFLRKHARSMYSKLFFEWSAADV